MKNIAFVAIALVAGFLLQVAWWRILRPSISSVLFVFALAFVLVCAPLLYWGLLDRSAADFARLTLLFISVALAYTTICPTIEAPSPTLTMIAHLGDRGREIGCPEDELFRRFIAQDGLTERLKLMQYGGLIRIVDGACSLTKKGVLIARLFEFAAKLFGLPKGG